MNKQDQENYYNNCDDDIFVEFQNYVYTNIFTKDNRIKLCKEFYNEFKRLPKSKEVYKDFKIGSFIHHLKHGCNKQLKEEVEKIFNTKIKSNKIEIKDDNEKLELCKEFYNEFKRLPKSKEVYKDFKIGRFIDHLKHGCNKQLKEEVEKIFNTKIKSNKIEIKDDDEKIELCKEYYNEFKRLPKNKEKYKNFNIYEFIVGLKKGSNSHLKEKVEKIFNTKIEYNRKIKIKDDNEKLELCKEFYNEHKRLPKRCEVYKDFKIGNFVQNLKHGKNNHLKEKVEKIFNTKIEYNKKIEIKDDNEKLELCKEFYNEHKRLPKQSEVYKDYKIGNFVQNLKHGKNNHLKEKVEKIFNTKIEYNKKIEIKDDNEKLELCKEFYNEHKRLPKNKEKYKNFNIYEFIVGLKKGSNSHLKEKVEKIFNTKIEYNKKIEIKDDNEKLELCKEFYNEHKRLPKQSEVYKDYKIGNFVQNLKHGKNNHLKEKVEKIFNTKIKSNKIEIKDDDEKIELCKEYYNEFKRLPKQNEVYKDYKIGRFIYGLKQGSNSHLKEKVEKIFNTKSELK